MPEHGLILDTCALLWLASGSPRLSKPARRRIDLERAVHVSAISAWEIGIKVDKGDLELPRPPRDWFSQAIARHGLVLAELDIDVLFAATELPGHHHDPADRFIIATALRHGLTVVTGDRRFRAYGVPVLE